MLRNEHFGSWNHTRYGLLHTCQEFERYLHRTSSVWKRRKDVVTANELTYVVGINTSEL